MAFGSGSDKIEIRIEVDNTGAVKILGDTEKAIGKTGTAAKESTGAIGSFTEGLIKGAAAAGTAYLSLKSVQTVLAGISRGSQVDDVSESFAKFSEKAGMVSDVLIGKLNAATANTISNFDLMQKSNELMSAGLKPENFETLAKAARSLSEVTGGELKESLDTVSQALVTGRDKSLALIGVQVDNTKALKDFADAIGTTSEELSEAGQVEAMRIAMLEALKNKQKELGDVELDAGDRIARINKLWDDSADSMASALSQNTQINSALDELYRVLNQIDLRQFSADVAVLVSDFLRLASDALPKVLKGFNELVESLHKLKILSDNGFDFEAATANLVSEKLIASFKEANIAAAELKKATEKIDLGQVSSNDVAFLKDYQAQVEKLQTAIKNGATLNTGDRSKTFAKELEEYQSLLKGLEKTIKPVSVALNKATDETGKFVDKNKQAEVALRKSKEASEAYKKSLDSQIASMKEEEKTINDLIKANEDLEKINRKIAEFDAAAAKEANRGFGSGFSDVFSPESSKDSLEQSGNIMGQMLLDGITEGLSLGLDGKSLRPFFDDLTEELGAEGGKALGTAIGGPIGGAIGEAIGRHVGDKIGDAIAGFGADSAGTKARKALDKWFNDNLKDLQFSGNQNPLDGAFSQMAADAQGKYSAIGDAMSVMLGGSLTDGVNLGVVLANNNITLAEMGNILGELGIGFDALAEKMMLAFYNGEMTALELQNRLEEIAGIVNGSMAFDDLGEAIRHALDPSTKGRDLIGTLHSVGVMAQSMGVTTFPQLAAIMQNTFGFTASQISMVIQSIMASGAKSVADFANYSNNQIVSVAANMQLAANGETPNKVAVQTVSAPKISVGGGGSANTGSTKTSGKSEKEKKEEAKRKEFLSSFEKALSSAKGRELDDLILNNQISEAEYTKQIQLLAGTILKQEKAVTDAETAYSKTVNKGAKEQAKALKKLLKARDDLEKSVAAAEKETKRTTLDRLGDFANKFAGNISLIEKAAKGLGVTFRTMEQQALAAFMAGTKTFAEANELMSGGKDPTKGFDAFRSLGTHGGAFSVDAIRSIGKASASTGAQTTDDIISQLLGGGAAKDDVQKFSIALKNLGITTTDQVANMTEETVVKLGSMLQDTQFGFKETTQTVRDELLALDTLINQERSLKIDADVIMSPELRRLLELTGEETQAPNGSTPPASTPGIDDGGKNIRAKDHDPKHKVKGGKKWWNPHTGKYTTSATHSHNV